MQIWLEIEREWMRPHQTPICNIQLVASCREPSRNPQPLQTGYSTPFIVDSLVVVVAETGTVGRRTARGFYRASGTSGNMLYLLSPCLDHFERRFLAWHHTNCTDPMQPSRPAHRLSAIPHYTSLRPSRGRSWFRSLGRPGMIYEGLPV